MRLHRPREIEQESYGAIGLGPLRTSAEDARVAGRGDQPCQPGGVEDPVLGVDEFLSLLGCLHDTVQAGDDRRQRHRPTCRFGGDGGPAAAQTLRPDHLGDGRFTVEPRRPRPVAAGEVELPTGFLSGGSEQVLGDVEDQRQARGGVTLARPGPRAFSLFDGGDPAGERVREVAGHLGEGPLIVPAIAQGKEEGPEIG